MAGGHWIQGAIKHPGALHRELGVPQGQKIPQNRLRHAASAGGKLGERARFAETLEHMPHRAFGGPVRPGQTVEVGERGPETFTPRMGGTVMPHAGPRIPSGRPRPMGHHMHMRHQPPKGPTQDDVMGSMLRQMGGTGGAPPQDEQKGPKTPVD